MAVALPGPSGSSHRKTNGKVMLAVNRVGPGVNQLAGGGPWSSQVELSLWATNDPAEQLNQQIPQGGHCEARLWLCLLRTPSASPF